MRILHIISSSGMYGAEAVILNLLRALQGPHSGLLGVFENSSNPNLQLHETALRHGLYSETIPCAGQLDRRTLAAIRDLYARSAATVIHAHGYKADIYVRIAFRGRRVPLVSTCHTWYDTDAAVTLYGRIDRFALRGYTRVVAVSEEVRQRLLHAGVREAKIRIVRNGIDLRPFAGAAANVAGTPITVGLAGRLAWEKGVDIFLAAAARVLQRHPDTRFLVAGEGPDRAALDKLIDDLNLRSNVTMLGRRDDMPAVYGSFDVMVSASRQEGLPMAILEGMASSRPIVATSVGEVPALIHDGETGLLVAPGDAEGLAGAISRLLDNPELRARLGSAAHNLVAAEYSSKRMTDEYLRIYQEAMEEVAGQRPSAPLQGNTH